MNYRVVEVLMHDVHGRRCPVARVSVSASWTLEQCLAYIHKIEYSEGVRPWVHITLDDIRFI